MERKKLLNTYTEEYEKVKAIALEISGVKELLYNEIDRLLSIEESQLKAVQAEEEILKKRSGELNGRLRQLPGIEKRVATLSRDISEYENIYSTLLKKKEEKRMNAAKTIDDLTIRVLQTTATSPRRELRLKEPPG